ncbi:phage tail tape measure protein [Clostridium senegalense]
MEKYTEKTEKRMRKLDKITASPSAKINDKISAPLDKVESRMNRFKDRVFVSTVKLEDRVSSPISKVQTQTDKFDKTESTAKLKVKDEASGTVEKVQSKFSNLSKFALKKIAAIATAGAIALGGIGIGSSVATFANFEQGMKNVQAISGATQEEFLQLTDKAKEMGRATSFTARDSADAFYYMGRQTCSVTKKFVA